jgi:hypothetical protein
MNAYRVKEVMWTVIVVMFILITLAGCSSAPVASGEHKPQYCYTSQTIVTENSEKVKSTTTVKCNDDPIERVAIKRAGLAKGCGYYEYRMKIGDKYVRRPGISCQLPDGSWERVE